MCLFAVAGPTLWRKKGSTVCDHKAGQKIAVKSITWPKGKYAIRRIGWSFEIPIDHIGMRAYFSRLQAKGRFLWTMWIFAIFGMTLKNRLAVIYCIPRFVINCRKEIIRTFTSKSRQSFGLPWNNAVQHVGCVTGVHISNGIQLVAAQTCSLLFRQSVEHSTGKQTFAAAQLSRLD